MQYILLFVASTVWSAAIAPDEALYRFQVRSLALAEELGKLSAAWPVMDIHHSTLHRWR